MGVQGVITATDVQFVRGKQGRRTQVDPRPSVRPSSTSNEKKPGGRASARAVGPNDAALRDCDYIREESDPCLLL